MLNRSEAAEGDFLRALVEVAGDALMVLDSACSMLYASSGLSRFSGSAASELVGSSATALFHPDDAARLLNEVHRMTASQTKRASFDCRMVSLDADVRTVQLELVNELANPAIDAFVVVVHDV